MLLRSLSFGVCALSLVACDDAPREAPPRTPDQGSATPGLETPFTPIAPLDGLTAPVPVPVEEEPPYLVSRFGPTLGLPQSRVVVLVAFDARDCAARAECSVTIGGATAEVVEDWPLFEVEVPDLATTGPLCLTWRGRTECSGEFTVLTAPLVYAVDAAARSEQIHFSVTGAGFLPDAEVWLGWEPLPTVWDAEWRLFAVAPGDRLAGEGEHQLFVYSPSTGRCGARSEPFTLAPLAP